jgi:hypothetical protein
MYILISYKVDAENDKFHCTACSVELESGDKIELKKGDKITIGETELEVKCLIPPQ